MSETRPHVSSETPRYEYDPSTPPVTTIEPGETVVLDTQDARAGSLDDREPGQPFDLPRPPDKGNPLTGPVAISGARPGDVLTVDIIEIGVADSGWVGGHAHVNPLAPGRVPRSLGRRVPIVDGYAIFSEHFRIPTAPMIGCIGTAIEGAPASGDVGRHGGNLDQPILTAGATVRLPVFVPDALLYVGDVHALQGDGELSGVGLEIAATVTLRIGLERNRDLDWPWATWGDRLAVMTADEDFVAARRDACDAMVTALESAYGIEPAEAMALLSIAGDLRIGQTVGRGPMTLRLEVPRWDGLVPT